MRRPISLCTLSLCLLLYLGCNKAVEAIKDFFSKEPEVEAVTQILKTTVPLGYAASLAMDAVHGDTADNVSFVTALAGTSGACLMAISIDSAHPLPVGPGRNGAIMVAGLWSSRTQAIISLFFTDFNLTYDTMTISNIATIPVKRDTSGIFAIYANQDINKGSDTAATFSLTNAEIAAELTRLNTTPPLDSVVEVGQEGWIIQVNANHTRGDPTDDIYTVSGGGQYISAIVDSTNSKASITQFAVILAGLGATCRRNPTSGAAIFRTYEVTAGDSASFPEIGTAILTFPSACNGNVELTLATGVYIGNIGETYPLKLDQ